VKSIAKPLEEKLAALASTLVLGNPLDPQTSVGAMIDESQLQRVRSQIDDAIAGGARVLAGGTERRDLGGYFFAPTVIAGVTQSMRLVREEIFGPVLPIIEVDDEREAIKLANDSHLALAASVWCRDLHRAEMVARQIAAGMVWINDGLYTHISPDAPWGGAKDSGYGRMHSAAELLDLVHVKNIGINKQSTQEWNFPYTAHSLEYIRGGIEVCHGAFLQKLQGGRKVLQYLFEKHNGQ
jgi:aldehyde dehydrogenase (NAD+)